MKKQIITKTFKNFEQAGKFYEKLCNKYNEVKLLNFPFFGGGVYQFEVK